MAFDGDPVAPEGHGSAPEPVHLLQRMSFVLMLPASVAALAWVGVGRFLFDIGGWMVLFTVVVVLPVGVVALLIAGALLTGRVAHLGFSPCCRPPLCSPAW